MTDFFKYLTSSIEDKNWGLYLTVAGKDTLTPNTAYPRKSHPTGYFFEWENGRILDEYQMILIMEGSGIMQIAEKEYLLRSGSLMIIRPGDHHRYRPNEDGWTEYYVGFKGSLAEHFISQLTEKANAPVLNCGNRVEILDCYRKISQLVLQQKPAYQRIASGLIIKLLGYISSHQRELQFEGKEVDHLIRAAKDHMWDQVNQAVDWQQFSKDHSVSYSYFRKAFKLYTGLAPHQYFLDLKMMRSKELLVSTEKTIKEIAFELGFDSIHYFSRIFKQKSGLAPSQFRN